MKAGTLVRYRDSGGIVSPPEGVVDGSLGVVLGFHPLNEERGPYESGYRPLMVTFGGRWHLVYEDEVEVVE